MIPASILSIQSHVAYGYVGNRAAVFPLQRLGFDVTAINTVQFSNHTGYGEWQGDIFTAIQLRALLDGIRSRGAFLKFSGLLSGYMGNPELGELIVEVAHELKAIHPSLIYCCDPVIGDIGRGVFVRPGVGEFFKSTVMQYADILTPNQFELAYLTGEPIETQAQCLKACEYLSAIGPSVILVTSLMVQETPENHIQMLLYTKDCAFLITTPRFELNPSPNGAGDMTAALLLAQVLKKTPWKTALENITASIYEVFEKTAQAGSRELQLIAAQDAFVKPNIQFMAERCSA